MRQSVQHKRDNTDAAGQAAPHGTDTAQAQVLSNSPRMSAQRQIIDLVQGSPRMSAQHKEMAILSGQAAQREEEHSVQRKAGGGLPENLKIDIENLSGMATHDVNAHRNSSKPAQLEAHAYAQGSGIRLAPGQERHLSHEAGHVVRQRQGRAGPTLQMNGVGVNDDHHLEAEADQMDSEALQLRTREPATAQRWASGSGAVQLIKASKKPKKPKLPEWEQIEATALEHAKKVRPTLEDDDEIEEFEGLVDDIKHNAKSVGIFVKALAKAPYRPNSMRPRRGVTDRPKVSKTNAKYKEDYRELIDSRMAALRKASFIIRKSYVVNSGGFSAKGRAHAGLGAEVLDAGAFSGKTTDNSFIKDTEINGVKLSDVKKVVKTEQTVEDEAAGPVIVMGKHSPSDVDKDKLLKQTDAGITPLNGNDAGPWNQDFANTPGSMSRGDGQFANMNKTNATGYAWLTGIAGWESQRWEWLHVRGAGLGGATNGINLVVGSRDSNTHMIPFESNVRTLATEAGKNPNYSHLNVQWGVESLSAPHKVDKIGMRWKLVGKKSNVKEPYGVVYFYPLVTGANISKTEVEFLETTLKQARETVTQ